MNPNQPDDLPEPKSALDQMSKDQAFKMLAACVLLLGGKVKLTPIELARLEGKALVIECRKGSMATLALHKLTDLPPDARAVAEQVMAQGDRP